MMKIVVLTHADVEQLLPIRECIPVMAKPSQTSREENVYQPLRMIITPPGAEGDMALMHHIVRR